MGIKKIVDFYFKFKGETHHKKSVYFSKEMLIDFIGEFWYGFFYNENDKLKYHEDYIIATAREVGKTYVAVAVIIYEMINNPLANFVLTRKYSSGAGTFYEMFNQVLNDFEDKYQVELKIEYSVEVKKNKKNKKNKDDKENKKITYQVIQEVNSLKGRGNNCLFSYGKTGDDKLAIFYNYNYDKTKNQICFLRGADDPDGSRGLSVNVGYIVLILLEEYSQEVDKGKLKPEEQITRYNSLHKSSNRYSVKMVEQHPDQFEYDFRTVNLALANIWDQLHPYNKALLEVITEDEWRSFVEADPEKNYLMVVKHNGNIFVRATSLMNTFLYPIGSEIRKEKVKEFKNIIKGNDDYAKAENLGYTFPGFIKNDNPIIDIINQLLDAEEMELDEFKKKYKITTAEYGTDPGLRDAWACTPAYLGESVNGNKIYINDLFIIDNAERRKNKEAVVPNPILKQLQLDFWKNDLKKLPVDIQHFLEVNMDMRALAIRDDYNYEIFPREKINGQCVAIPSQESQGYGLEQRPSILSSLISKMVFSPLARIQLLDAFKTLEPYAEDKKQPHPRKGKVDIYDSFAYAVVKLRGYV